MSKSIVGTVVVTRSVFSDRFPTMCSSSVYFLALGPGKTRTHCGGNIVSCDVARPWQNEETLLRAARTQGMFLKIFRNIFWVQDLIWFVWLTILLTNGPRSYESCYTAPVVAEQNKWSHALSCNHWWKRWEQQTTGHSIMWTSLLVSVTWPHRCSGQQDGPVLGKKGTFPAVLEERSPLQNLWQLRGYCILFICGTKKSFYTNIEPLLHHFSNIGPDQWEFLMPREIRNFSIYEY